MKSGALVGGRQILVLRHGTDPCTRAARHGTCACLIGTAQESDEETRAREAGRCQSATSRVSCRPFRFLGRPSPSTGRVPRVRLSFCRPPVHSRPSVCHGHPPTRPSIHGSSPPSTGALTRLSVSTRAPASGLSSLVDSLATGPTRHSYHQRSYPTGTSDTGLGRPAEPVVRRARDIVYLNHDPCRGGRFPHVSIAVPIAPPSLLTRTIVSGLLSTVRRDSSETTRQRAEEVEAQR